MKVPPPGSVTDAEGLDADKKEESKEERTTENFEDVGVKIVEICHLNSGLVVNACILLLLKCVVPYVEK